MNLSSISGGHDVTRIGQRAFYNSHFGTLDLASVFPNLLEIDATAFGSTKTINKLVLPRNYVYIEEGAFGELQDVTAIYDSFIDRYYPYGRNTFRLILPGNMTNILGRINMGNSGQTSNLPIENFYIEFENKNNYVAAKSFGDLFLGKDVKNLYLPEGVSILRYHELGNENGEVPGNIFNLIIPTTVMEIDEKAFEMNIGNESVMNTPIKNVLLPKQGKDSAQLQHLKEKILNSGHFKYNYEDSNYIYFTDPSFKFDW